MQFCKKKKQTISLVLFLESKRHNPDKNSPNNGKDIHLRDVKSKG